MLLRALDASGLAACLGEHLREKLSEQITGVPAFNRHPEERLLASRANNQCKVQA